MNQVYHVTLRVTGIKVKSGPSFQSISSEALFEWIISWKRSETAHETQ